MSVDYSVRGVKPADDKYMKMKAIWDACDAMGVGIPHEVGTFFGWETPNGKGIVVDLPDDCVEEIAEYGSRKYDVDITKLPKDVTVVRFIVGW